MKRIIKINILVMSTIVAFCSAHGQQKPSQRSYSSVVNEIKQRQAMREKMIQQIKQTTLSQATSQDGTMQFQPANPTPAAGSATQPRAQSTQKPTQQPVNNTPANQPPQPAGKIKKQ